MPHYPRRCSRSRPFLSLSLSRLYKTLLLKPLFRRSNVSVLLVRSLDSFHFFFFFLFPRNFTMKQFSVVARCLRLLSTRFRVAFTRPVHAIFGRFETLTSVDGVNFTLQVTRGISANRLVDGELHASVAVQLDMRATVSAPINCTYAFARATNIERRIKSCADKGFRSWIYHVATVLSSWLR